MSKTPWTPGPWLVSKHIDTWVMAGRLHVATIPTAVDGDFSRHNARLIAQSPRMAEVLERVLEDANRTKRGLTNRITPDTRIEVARLLAEIRGDQ